MKRSQHSRYWLRMLEVLDKYFAKDSEGRGEALVMLAYIDILLLEDDL